MLEGFVKKAEGKGKVNRRPRTLAQKMVAVRDRHWLRTPKTNFSTQRDLFAPEGPRAENKRC